MASLTLLIDNKLDRALIPKHMTLTHGRFAPESRDQAPFSILPYTRGLSFSAQATPLSVTGIGGEVEYNVEGTDHNLKFRFRVPVVGDNEYSCEQSLVAPQVKKL